jgi:hypothetical protein
MADDPRAAALGNHGTTLNRVVLFLQPHREYGLIRPH